MVMLIDWDTVIVTVWEALDGASPWLAPILWAAAAVAALALWVKVKGWAKVKAVVAWVHKAVTTVDQVLTIVNDVTYIKAQLTANGGSSVKDQAATAAKLSQQTADRVEEMHAILTDTRKIARRAADTARTAKTSAAETQRILIDHVSATAAKAEKQ